MVKKLMFPGVVLGVVALMSLGFKPHGASTKAILWLQGDTKAFQANTAAGWDLLSSCLNQKAADSVELELILKQDNAINWRAEQLIGTITNSSFLPKKIQRLSYDLLSDNQWVIRITPGGQCLLSQFKGLPLPPSSLAGNPFVLPLKIKYEKK